MNKQLAIFSILALSLSFVLFGCGQEGATDKDFIPIIEAELPKEPVQSFNFFKLHRMFEKGSKEADLTEKAQEIVNKRENPAGRLPEAIGYLNEVLNMLPKKSYGDCQKEVKAEKYPPAGVCNQWANIHAKISEIYFFMGESEKDIHKQQDYYFRGKEAGKEAGNYNPNNVAGLFTGGSNLGSWLGVSYKIWVPENQSWLSKRKAEWDHQETLESTPGIIEGLLTRAEKIQPNFYQGMLQLSLGHLYHKVDPKYLTNKGGFPLAERYINNGKRLMPGNHYGHYYAFQFYSNPKVNRREEAQSEANWLIKNADDPTFRKKHPITAEIEKKAALDYLNK